MTDELTRPDNPKVDPAIARQPPAGPYYSPDDYVRIPKSGRGWLRIMVVLGIITVGIVLAYGMLNRWVDNQVNPSGGAGEAVEFTIEDGWSTNRVAEELASEDVISNSTIFRYWLRCPSFAKPTLGCDRTIDASFQSGDYELTRNMAFGDVLEVLEAGPEPERFLEVLIPEGLVLEELQERMVSENPQFSSEDWDEAFSDGLIVSSFDPPQLYGVDFMEGLFFPAKYDVAEDDAADELKLLTRMAETMTARFAEAEEKVGRAQEAIDLGLTDYEILIIASMIEAEAKVDADRPKISRVIYNRLQAGEPLGIDATARYAGFDPADSEFESDYNTRLNVGLPPTPIGAPGSLAIEAALAPEPGPWFYYVLTNEGGVDGAHRFVETAAEFEEAKQVCIDLDLGCG